MSDPTVLHRPDGLSDWRAVANPTVTKIVVGKLDADKPMNAPALPDDFATLFPALTHLYLWNIRTLNALPALRAEMRTLEVRKCPKFRGSQTLPRELETLDFSECPELVDFPKNGLSGLRHLHLDKCSKLAAKIINRFVDDCVELEELTAINCVQIETLNLPEQSAEAPVLEVWQHPRFPPTRLKKLVLSGCEGLRSLPDLSAYPWLHHLDLDCCSKLERLAPICADYDRGIRYLSTAGCHALRSFGAPDNPMDVREPHRSTSRTDNVATQFRTMQRLSGTPVDHVMAKVLLLGSGRCGKTSLAKVLRELPADPKEKSTVGIKFWPWSTKVEWDPKRGEKLATAHVWDFAGQEIYHNTHRLFASVGTVFVIVTCSQQEHQSRIEFELAGLPEEERSAYRRENEYRELKYWLDYLRSVRGLRGPDDFSSQRGKVAVRVVYTGSNSVEDAKADLLRQAGIYADLLSSGDIPFDAVDLLEAPSGAIPTRTWVRACLGRAADELGTRVPEVFAKVSARCEKVVEYTTRTGMPSADQLINFESWLNWVEQEASPLPESTNERLGLRLEQAEATARYLHECGRIFWLGRVLKHEQGDVIIDQTAIANTIYHVCTAGTAKRIRAIANAPMTRIALEEELRSDPEFKVTLANDPGRIQVFFDMLDACNTCVRIAGDRWIGVQRELLPDGDEAKAIHEEARTAWHAVAGPGEGFVNHSFALHGDHGGLLGNSDYRDVMAHVLRGMDSDVPRHLFGDDEEEGWRTVERASYEDRMHYNADSLLWRDGFQVVFERRVGDHPKATEAAVLRVEWAAMHDPERNTRHYEGGLFFQLLCTNEEPYARRLEAILFGDKGPLELFKDKVARSDERPPDLAQHQLPCLRGEGAPGWADHSIHRDAGEVAVAISFRTADVGIANQLGKALKDELHGTTVGHVVWYSDADFERDRDKPAGSRRITELYHDLKHAKLLIVIASKDYFEPPSWDAATGKGTNLYCPVELAEAMPRHASDTLIILRVDLAREKMFGRISGIFPEYRTAVIGPRFNAVGCDSNKLSAIDTYEHAAIAEASDHSVMQFLDRYGRDFTGSIDVSGSATWLADTIARVKQALGVP